MKPPIGVFTALAWESAAVRSVLRQVRREGEGVWRGSTGRHDVVIITGGIGPRRTRQTVEQFVATPLTTVFSIGCAGALTPGPTTGQLILAPAVRMYAEEQEGQDEQSEQEERLDTFPVHPDLLDAARTAATHAGVETAEGAIFTSRRVLFSPEEKHKRGRETDCIAVEMESGVYAEFAAQRELPFLVLRVILDAVDMTIPPMKGITTPDGNIRMTRALTHMVTHPQHLPFLLRLKRCRAGAAEAIARICRALFPLLNDRDLI